jgi:hypothetical protein
LYQGQVIQGGLPGQGLEMTRSVIGGGVMQATGGGFELAGGFWFPIPPGDYNDDGLVNLLDYAAFSACLTGPGGDADGFDCAVFDVDRSGDVDLLDFAEIQRTFSGM